LVQKNYYNVKKIPLLTRYEERSGSVLGVIFRMIISEGGTSTPNHPDPTPAHP